MVVPPPVAPWVFKAIEKSDIKALSCCREDEIRPILPCLVRMSLIAPLDHSEECIAGRKVILRILSGIEAVNSLVALLSIDFSSLEVDVKKEQSLRQKMGGGNQSESILVQNLANGLALEFECSDPTKRLRLLLCEILLVLSQIREPRQDFFHKTSELFDNPCYLEEVGDVLCVALAELPALLLPADVAEALLHLTGGPKLICRMVANQPDCFREVVTGLVMNGEKQDEESQGGLIRLSCIRLLCQMNPSQALNVRALCVDQCVMPALTVFITLDIKRINSNISGDQICNKGTALAAEASASSDEDRNDIISFITGLLLSHDYQQRTWFSQFIKSAQRRKMEHPTSAFVALRTELSVLLRSLVLFTNNDTLADSQVIHATSLLTLYCALKSLAGLKFSEDKEISLLLQLVTCRPPPSAAGVKFVSTGLCMLIACPSLIASSENEKRATEWIKWLAKEEAYFAGAIGVSSSFGAMLLLMAIHFLVNQMSAIVDLVSAALGMKVLTKAASLNRIKSIFTHEVFTEQVLTAHAVKVPVTKSLNANIPNFLPVHCIYHQLKSRMFTKHKVPIKDWIYKQICSSVLPLHPVMPQLIDVYVNSILCPPGKGSYSDVFNEPITEDEIMAVFSLSTFNDSSMKNTKSSYVRKNSSSICLRSSSKRKLLNMSSVLGTKPTEISSTNQVIEVYHQKSGSKIIVESVMTSQLLLLYYLLLYEDLRLSNTYHLIMNNRRAHTYSPHLFAQLPIRYLLSNAQKEQKMYAGMFCSLLKLLVTHYPQLCLVEDWLYQQPSANAHLAILPPELPLTSTALTQALEDAVDNPGRLLVMLDRMIRLPPHQLWTLAHSFTSLIKCLLRPEIPRKVLDMYRLVWLRLNSLFPRRLWAMTVEALRPDYSCSVGLHKPLSEDDIVLDPLYVLRCDQRVFRCAPILQIVIYMLQVYLLSSQTFLNQHVQNNPVTNFPPNSAPSTLEEEREKLKCALILTQESSAAQILLETSILDDDKLDSNLAVQEIQSIICSYLHQAFIKDTTLAKLVQFQGYPKELIGPLVRGVPSMHIAVGLNWIPELLQLPDLEKQMFAVELTSHLALQNSMPSTLSISRLAVNTLATLVSVLGQDERLLIMDVSLDSLVRIGRAFPALQDDLVHLLVTYGRIATAQSALVSAPSSRNLGIMKMKMSGDINSDFKRNKRKDDSDEFKVPPEDQLLKSIISAFRNLIIETSMSLDIY